MTPSNHRSENPTGSVCPTRGSINTLVSPIGTRQRHVGGNIWRKPAAWAEHAALQLAPIPLINAWRYDRTASAWWRWSRRRTWDTGNMALMHNGTSAQTPASIRRQGEGEGSQCASQLPGWRSPASGAAHRTPTPQDPVSKQCVNRARLVVADLAITNCLSLKNLSPNWCWQWIPPLYVM